MQKILITLPSVTQVQRFVKALTPLHGDFELISEPYVLDARSLMGVFSLDLTQPILLKIYDASPENLQAIQPFLTDAKEN